MLDSGIKSKMWEHLHKNIATFICHIKYLVFVIYTVLFTVSVVVSTCQSLILLSFFFSHSLFFFAGGGDLKMFSAI